MDGMSDDVVAQILKRVNNVNDRRSCSQVCQQWRRMEGFTRQKLRILGTEFLECVLQRFPNIVSLEAEVMISDADLSLISENCRALESVRLSISKYRRAMEWSWCEDQVGCEMGDEGICTLATSCRELRVVILRWRQKIGHLGVAALVRSCSHLVHLDLGHCKGINDKALEAISGAASLQVLILKSCTISDKGLSSLVGSCAARSLKHMDLCDCDRLTDNGIVLLQQFSSLKSLNLSECGPRITDIGGVAMAGIATLQSLNLSWLVNVSDVTMLALSHSCSKMRDINLSGCELITGVGLHAFVHHKSLQTLTLYGCYSVNGDDIEQVAMGCQSLRYLGLDHSLRSWMREETLRNIQSHVTLEWL